MEANINKGNQAHFSSHEESYKPFNSPEISVQYLAAEGDEKISIWLHSDPSATMQAPSETHSDDHNSLGDSAYEFIDTDEESRDGNATESIASTDFGGQDDVASLAETERSDDDSASERSHVTSGIPAFTGLDEPTNTPTIDQSIEAFSEDSLRQGPRAIEFEEPFELGTEIVSVKHTIADFNEHQTEQIAQRMALVNPPNRMVATIRQNMTKQGLSTREPLRILYIGSHSAKQDIIHKIASSVAASVEDYPGAGSVAHRPSQIFNVVPVSAFGSEKTPEIELMHSSGYQIKVEDCSAATSMKVENEPDKPDVIKITLEDSFSCHSVPVLQGPGFLVEPYWELPHVAVFYCSDNDTHEMRRTRFLSHQFMSRHHVPSIVISHKQLLDKMSVDRSLASSMALDQHAIHICLESRDPHGPRNIIHQRLPIDLASFMNIDARQMNRNLAYLTRLHKPLDLYPASKAKVSFGWASANIEKASHTLSDSIQFLRNRAFIDWSMVVPFGLLLFSVFSTILTGIYINRPAPSNAVSINGSLTPTNPIPDTSNAAMSSSSVMSSSLRTSTETRTATKTITVTHSRSSVPNSLSVVPAMEVSKLTEKVKNAATPKATEALTVCNVKVLGDREILIRIPTATKLSWLNKEAMSVDVSRNNESVEMERVYSSADGIILLFPKRDAYGLLNISIVTTKRPKINETFQIDFGHTWRQELYDLFGRLSTQVSEDVRTLDVKVEKAVSRIQTLAEQCVAQTKSLTDLTRQCVEEANRKAKIQAVESTTQLTELAKSLSLDLAKRSAILSKELSIQFAQANERLARKVQSLQHFREPLDDGLIRAQVQSKLYWLQIQGKHVEYQEYEQRAAKAAKASRHRHEETIKAKRTADEPSWAAQRAAKKVTRREARVGKKCSNAGVKRCG